MALFLLLLSPGLCPAAWDPELLPFGTLQSGSEDWNLPPAPRHREAWERLAVKDTPAPQTSSLPTLLAEDLLWTWQHSLSGHDGSQCPHYPSCSRYSLIAVDDYGVLAGVIMTAERLERCHDDANAQGQYAWRAVNGQLMIWDPPKLDAWWLQK
jgi:putative component of membrane protein insertase Oxa1/YidC/SpoIIIJ protein YidD